MRAMTSTYSNARAARDRAVFMSKPVRPGHEPANVQPARADLGPMRDVEIAS